MSTKKQMVLTFLFDKKGEYVVLMRRNKPDWQSGKLNGVGGAVLDGETIKMAAYREFDEAGYDLLDGDEDPVKLEFYGVFSGPDYEVHCFRGFDDTVLSMDIPVITPHFLQVPSEKLQKHYTSRVKAGDFNNVFVPPVPMLVDLALSNVSNFSITYKQ